MLAFYKTIPVVLSWMFPEWMVTEAGMDRGFLVLLILKTKDICHQVTEGRPFGQWMMFGLKKLCVH